MSLPVDRAGCHNVQRERVQDAIGSTTGEQDILSDGEQYTIPEAKESKEAYRLLV